MLRLLQYVLEDLRLPKHKTGIFSQSYLDNAYLEAQSVGKTSSLCAAGSSFESLLNECEECIRANSANATNLINVDPLFQQFIDFCEGSAPNNATSSTTIQSADTSASDATSTGAESTVRSLSKSASGYTSGTGPGATAISYTIATSWLTVSEETVTTTLAQLTGSRTVWTIIVQTTVTRADWTGFSPSSITTGRYLNHHLYAPAF